MVMWCWEMEPDRRPSFSTLVQTLSKSLEKMADYLHVGAFTSLSEEKTCYAHVGAIAENDCEAQLDKQMIQSE